VAAKKPKKPSSQKAAGAGRRKTALQLHIEGHTFAVIAQRLGVGRTRAHQLVTEELAAAAKERSALATKALDADLERIDFVLRSLAPKVTKGDDKAASAYLRALTRRAALLGLDAPTRSASTLSGPDGGPIAHEIAATQPDALHARLAAAAARAALGAQPGAAREPDGDGAG
jgi:hypothetical protein